MSADVNHEVSLTDIIDDKEPIWDMAEVRNISVGEAVKIPIDMGNTYAIVGDKTRDVVPFSSLNYLMIYKDSLQSTHIEWVYLMPDSVWLYGNRNSYSGRVLVRTWAGGVLKKYTYLPVKGADEKYGKLKKTSSIVEPVVTDPIVQPICLTITYSDSRKCTCSPAQLQKYGCDNCSQCVSTSVYCAWPVECVNCEDPPVGGGGGGGSSGGVGGGGSGSAPGGASSGDYPPNCNSDPGYVTPTLPAPPGTQWILPCGSIPIPVPYSPPPNTEEPGIETQPPIISDPDNQDWSDPDNLFLFDSDQTIYSQYQDNQSWPTISPVIPTSSFVKNRYVNGSTLNTVNCLVLSKEQLGEKGYTTGGYDETSPQIFQAYKTATGVDIQRTREGLSYIISALGKGIPVLVGVDVRAGAPTANKDNSTDHFVVIVGSGTDAKGKFLRFYDSSTNWVTLGTSSDNKLYFDSITGKVSGKTQSQYGSLKGHHDYILTHIRKSIKK